MDLANFEFDFSSLKAPLAAATAINVGFTLDPDGVWAGSTGNDYWDQPDRGSSTIYGWTGADVIKAGDQPDELHGQGGPDTIWGRGGYDRMFGEKGNDTLRGGDASDIVNGGDDDDRCFGDAGNDLVIGGKGNDQETGGTGPDAFMFYKEDFANGKYTDHILDFHAAEADAIHFSASEKGHIHVTNTAEGAHITSDLQNDTIIVDHTTAAQLAGHLYYDLA